MTQVAINRPWTQSFNFKTFRYSETQLEQFHKLCRNYVASLDLGCPSAKHVDLVDRGVDTSDMDEREKYLQWVKGWKQIYSELSKAIRQMKTHRRTVRFPKLNSSQLELIAAVNPKMNQTPMEHLRTLQERHLPRLQETAMVLLNARYNAKLAAGARRLQLQKR